MTDPKPYTIMVVEDETLLLQAISKKLEINHLNTVSCSSGEQALGYLQDGIIPHAIWLDYYLKDMNGLEFVQVLKKNPTWSKIPILVVSNSASEDKVASMLALGVNKYLLKAEYRLDDLIDIITKLS